MHLNVKSIESNFEELSVFLETLEKKPDLIALPETWEVKTLGLYILNDYMAFEAGSDISKAGGVILYVHNRIGALADVATNSIGDLKVIEVNIGVKDETDGTFITVIYRPHGLKKEKFIQD